MGLIKDSWTDFYRKANTEMLIEELTKLGYDLETKLINPTHYYDLGKIDTEDLQHNNFIDTQVYKKVSETLSKQQLSQHLDNICFLLRKGYVSKAFYFLNRNQYVEDIQNLFQKIDTEHTQITFKGITRDLQFSIKDNALILFIKKALTNELLSSSDVQFDLANIYNGTFIDELKENENYFIVMHQIATYLKAVNEGLRLSENKIFEITFNILNEARLLPKEQLNEFDKKIDDEKSKYVRISINNLYGKKPFLNPDAKQIEFTEWEQNINMQFDNTFIDKLNEINIRIAGIKTSIIS